MPVIEYNVENEIRQTRVGSVKYTFVSDLHVDIEIGVILPTSLSYTRQILHDLIGKAIVLVLDTKKELLVNSTKDDYQAVYLICQEK